MQHLLTGLEEINSRLDRLFLLMVSLGVVQFSLLIFLLVRSS